MELPSTFPLNEIDRLLLLWLVQVTFLNKLSHRNEEYGMYGISFPHQAAFLANFMYVRSYLG